MSNFDPEFRRALFVAGLFVLAIAGICVRGYRSRHPLPPKRVTAAEFEKSTSRDLPIIYHGIDRGSHRFETLDRRVFLIGLKDLEIPAELSANPHAALYVTIENGKVRAPDRDKIAAAARQSGVWIMDPAQKEKVPRSDGSLTVVRYDFSEEPAVLSLASDGDWSDHDLARLDSVLDDWLRSEPRLRGQGGAIELGAPPVLRYDEAETAGERKSVVIHTERFKSSWCDSLGKRLIREFPFLWWMEVGRIPEFPSHFDWEDSFIEVPRRQIRFDDGRVATVEPFEVARYPISMKQFVRFVEATGYVTAAEQKGYWKTFRDQHGREGPVPEHLKVLPAQFICYDDAVAYCRWAGVRLPTAMEHLAASLLDERAHPRTTETFKLMEKLSSSPRALRGEGNNFTSTFAEDGQVVCCRGPILGFEGESLAERTRRHTVKRDAFKEHVALRVCKGTTGSQR
jgi:hypothetical protein